MPCPVSSGITPWGSKPCFENLKALIVHSFFILFELDLFTPRKDGRDTLNGKFSMMLSVSTVLFTISENNVP